MVRILSIETCFKSCSVAFYVNNNLVNYQEEKEANKQAEKIIDLIDNAIGDNKVDCIATNNGPGSFTGIRVGVAACEAFLTFNPDLQMIYVNSLEALSVDLDIKHDTCLAMKASLPNHFYTQRFSATSFGLVSVGQIEIVSELPSDAILISDTPNAMGVARYAYLQLTNMPVLQKFETPLFNYVRAGDYQKQKKNI